MIGELVGGMADSAHRAGSTTYDAEYAGLAGHTFAVVAQIDRATQVEFPAVSPSLVQRVDVLLAANAGAVGHVPGDKVTEYLSNNPQWVAWPRGRLADELNVDRIVYIEINDFRTNEPGNEYLWDGVGWATVSVIERGESGSDVDAFRKEIRVKFPDNTGIGPAEVSKQGVASTLLKRLVDRTAWLFYQHSEPNSLEY